jgi:uncharacterized membrane protein
MTTANKRDIVTGLLLISMALLLVLVLIPLGVVEPKKVKFAALSPSYYPRLVGYCLLAIGALMVVTRWFGAKRDSADETAPAQTRSPRVLLVLFLILFAFYWTLPHAGFVLGSALALLCLLLLAGERRPLMIIAIAIIVPSLLYLFFTKVANIPIPAGVLEPWLIRL